MKQVAGFISTYSSDEFGICSALYELGGMVVMHDASGCNSTYTTHDEPRWYDMDSMIYISAISEMEAIMGDDEKLIQDLIETASKLKPAFIAIVGAPIPYMIGTDLPAIAAITEQQTGIPSFGFPANGMHDYVSGMSMALGMLARKFCKREIEKAEKLTVNLLGATPLDFSINGSVDSMKLWIQESGMEMGACMAMGCTLEEIKMAGRAHVNLVVSYGGLAAAKEMERIFGIPYVVGVPVGKSFANFLAEELKKAADEKKSVVAYQQVPWEEQISIESGKKRPLVVIGESVYSASLACAIQLELGLNAKVFCPLETEDALLRECDLRTPEEDDLRENLPMASGMIADPLYQPICPEGVKFYPLPHVAFSGRIYEESYPNLINRNLVQE